MLSTLKYSLLIKVTFSIKRNRNAECFKFNKTIIVLIHLLFLLAWNSSILEIPRKKTAQHDHIETQQKDEEGLQDVTDNLLTRYKHLSTLIWKFLPFCKTAVLLHKTAVVYWIMQTNYDNRCLKARGKWFSDLILNKDKTFEAMLSPLLTWFMPPMSRRKTNCSLNVITSSISKRRN